MSHLFKLMNSTYGGDFIPIERAKPDVEKLDDDVAFYYENKDSINDERFLGISIKLADRAIGLLSSLDLYSEACQKVGRISFNPDTATNVIRSKKNKEVDELKLLSYLKFEDLFGVEMMRQGEIDNDSIDDFVSAEYVNYVKDYSGPHHTLERERFKRFLKRQQKLYQKNIHEEEK